MADSKRVESVGDWLARVEAQVAILQWMVAVSVALMILVLVLI
jgi:hypothetical protein